LIHFCSVLVLFRPSCHLRSTTVFLQHNTNIHAPGGIRTHDPSKRAAEDQRLRPHGHWDRRKGDLCSHFRTYTSILNNSKWSRTYLHEQSKSLDCVQSPLKRGDEINLFVSFIKPRCREACRRV
jgi:hypothetical protein